MRIFAETPRFVLPSASRHGKTALGQGRAWRKPLAPAGGRVQKLPRQLEMDVTPGIPLGPEIIDPEIIDPFRCSSSRSGF